MEFNPLEQRKMIDQNNNEEIETSVFVLGTAYAASLIGMIFLLSA